MIKSTLQSLVAASVELLECVEAGGDLQKAFDLHVDEGALIAANAELVDLTERIERETEEMEADRREAAIDDKGDARREADGAFWSRDE